MKETKIILLLTQAYAAELETVQNYLANSVWLDGLGGHVQLSSGVTIFRDLRQFAAGGAAPG